MNRDYLCRTCEDKGIIYRFLGFIATECPACRGDPMGTWRREHPTPHMPPEKKS